MLEKGSCTQSWSTHLRVLRSLGSVYCSSIGSVCWEVSFAHAGIVNAVLELDSLSFCVCVYDARSLVRRLAYNYEHGSSLENRIAVVLNQEVRQAFSDLLLLGVHFSLQGSATRLRFAVAVCAVSQPRLFRDAFSRSIGEEVDALLHDFIHQMASSAASKSHSAPPESAFILFYFSDHIVHKRRRENDGISDDKASKNNNNTTVTTASPNRHVSSFSSSLGFKSPLAIGSPLSALQSPRVGPTANVSLRTVYASTRSLFPHRDTRQHHTKRKKKVKKNAVMDHAEPPVFQRVVVLRSPQSETNRDLEASAEHPAVADSSRANEANNTDTIVHVVVPLVKEVIPFFSTGGKQKRQHSSPEEQQHTRKELKQLTWKHFPVVTPHGTSESAPSTNSKHARSMDLLAWKQEHCLIIYPSCSSDDTKEDKKTSSEVSRLKKQRERKAAVIALFAALEPLVRAFMIART